MHHELDGDLWEVWYRDLANIIREIADDLVAGRITVDEALERVNKL